MKQVLGIRDEAARMKVTPPLAVVPLAHGDDMRWNPNDDSIITFNPFALWALGAARPSTTASGTAQQHSRLKTQEAGPRNAPQESSKLYIDQRFEHPGRTWASATHRAFSFACVGAAMANETWKFVQAKSKQAMKQVLGIRDEAARMTVTPPLAVAPLAHGDDMRWNPNDDILIRIVNPTLVALRPRPLA